MSTDFLENMGHNPPSFVCHHLKCWPFGLGMFLYADMNGTAGNND
ncbi:hypothetical protein SLEP1_g56399 [Rubroshorea leprosula]|uniref:Uncharacterized protein n=1 Tax=Rubroshorea leprosula TaxID=152421 RepID=A0AAV5MID6_9ROSI|nr:hypothetical protein SLEP1_g56399 [Rubroshorea leprosula]